MEIRSFLAFELPLEIKKIVSQLSAKMRGLPLDIRWVNTDNIHLTIVFMGNIIMEHLEPAGNEAAKACQRYGPFKISLKNVGIFGSNRNPRILWIKLQGDIERMSHFRDALQKKLAPFGIKQEKRRFNPHLTLGRFRRGSKTGRQLDEFLSEYQVLASPICDLNELVMFKSDLTGGGAVYSKLNTWPLTGRH